MPTLVKICGLNEPVTLEAALDAGVDMIGFVRFPRSPRHISLEQGRALSGLIRGRAARVLLSVDASDGELEASIAALDPDLLQLHGHESPERVGALRARFGRPVIKAVGIGSGHDLGQARLYASVADHVLLDAKPPAGASLPGGNGAAFDWRLLTGFARENAATLMLSGGLSPGNVAEAIETTEIGAVDVSSGVETRPGVKDAALIEAFVAAVRAALQAQRIPA